MSVIHNMSDKPKDSLEAIERENSQLIAMFTGAALASVATLALAILVIRISEIALLWAYLILGILIALSIAFIIFWWRRGEISQKLIGVPLRSFGDILDAASVDVQNSDYRSLVVHRAREVLATYSAIRIRAGVISFAVVLLGELVLLINAAMLIQQTSAIRQQTQVAELQRVAIERQNELLNQKDRKELFWQMFHDDDLLSRPEYFLQLISVGKRRFSGIRLVRANLRKQFLNSLAIENSELVASFFDGADITSSSFDGTDLSECSFKDVFVDASFRNAILDNATFDGADVSRAVFDNTSLRGADFTNAKGMTVELFLNALTLVDAKGIPIEVVDDLKALNPDLF